MIHIFGKYYAKADENQITVGIPYETPVKDGGTRTVMRDAKYYSTLTSALRGTYNRLSLDTLQSIDGDLKDAVKATERLQTAFLRSVDRLDITIDADDGK